MQSITKVSCDAWNSLKGIASFLCFQNEMNHDCFEKFRSVQIEMKLAKIKYLS